MKNLLIILIVSFFPMLASGCSEQAKKQPASAGSSQEPNASGLETNIALESSAGANSDHVSGTSSPSSSNISGN